MCVDGVLYFEEYLSEARLKEKWVCIPSCFPSPHHMKLGMTLNRGTGGKLTSGTPSNLIARRIRRTGPMCRKTQAIRRDGAVTSTRMSNGA